MKEKLGDRLHKHHRVADEFLTRCLRDEQMPGMRKKADLPRKVYESCGRVITRRKKWARDWDYVRFCSDRCWEAKREKAPNLGL
jgi:hypothetical protein